MTIHPWSSLDNFSNWWFLIRKKKLYLLINLINKQNYIDKIYLYARDLSEPKYEYLIKKREDVGIKHINNPNAFIECSNTMDDVYENINDYNSSRRRTFYLFLITSLQILWQIKNFKP